MRGFRIILLILMLAIIAGLGAGAWLITSQPQPRETERWSLGPSLPAPRGELATAVGYARPCPTPPCADSGRLFVLGGLSGFFNPKSQVEFSIPYSIPGQWHHSYLLRAIISRRRSLATCSMSVAVRTLQEAISVISIGRPKAIAGG